jgi:hypothetical protein
MWHCGRLGCERIAPTGLAGRRCPSERSRDDRAGRARTAGTTTMVCATPTCVRTRGVRVQRFPAAPSARSPTDPPDGPPERPTRPGCRASGRHPTLHIRTAEACPGRSGVPERGGTERRSLDSGAGGVGSPSGGMRGCPLRGRGSDGGSVTDRCVGSASGTRGVGGAVFPGATGFFGRTPRRDRGGWGRDGVLARDVDGAWGTGLRGTGAPAPPGSSGAAVGSGGHGDPLVPAGEVLGRGMRSGWSADGSGVGRGASG